MEEIESKVLDIAEKHFGNARIRNNQLVTDYCPFCEGGPSKDRYTFSVGLHSGAYSCLRGSCGVKGSLTELCRYFGERPVTSYKLPTQKTEKVYSIPDPSILNPLTEEAITYMAMRRISEATLKAFNVSCDQYGNLVFPFYRDGTLTFVKHRKACKHKKEDGPKEWPEANTEPILFGMDNAAFDTPLYITEGEIDALSLYEAGIHNVVSVPMGCNNLDWINLCWDWLDRFQQIIVFGDNDVPGQKMIDTVIKRLGEDRCLSAPEYPEMFYGEKDLGRLCKDANEILYVYGPERLNEIANSCEQIPVKGLINLADVQFVDPSSIPRVMTQMPELDNMIGGLSDGSVTVFTGKRGSGKSTFNGTLLLNAIEQGHRICALIMIGPALSNERRIMW